jgi:Putative adhesin
MRAAILLPAVAAGMLLFSACDIEDFSGARYDRDFHYSFPLDANGKVTIETFNGGIEISGWDQANVDISGTKYGPTQEIADSLDVRVDHTPSNVSIHVQQPSVHHGNLGAKFIMKVPRTAVLEYLTTSNGGIRVADAAGPARLRTSNGGIRVAGLSGGLEAHTSNGGITADLDRVEGEVRLETSNGSIEVRLPDRIRDGVRAHTSNGGITVRLPEGLDARVSAHTSNAHVTSDFDVRMQGEIERNRLEGQIGKGGPLLDLSTSNGSIHLARM